MFSESFVYNDPAFQSKPLEFMSRDEIYTEGLRRTTTSVLRKDELGDLIQNPTDLAHFNRLVFTHPFHRQHKNDSHCIQNAIVSENNISLGKERRQWYWYRHTYNIVGRGHFKGAG